MRNFGNVIDADCDFEVRERIIAGRMTKRRYEIIARAVRKDNVGHIPVYSDYDCTGQLCGQYTEATWSANKVVITTRFSYDY